MVFGRTEPGLRKAKAKSRFAGDRAADIRAGERLERSRSRTDFSSVPRLEDLAYSHACRPSNDLSTLFAANHGFGKGVQRDIFGEKLFQDGAECEYSAAFKCRFIERNRNLEPTGEGNRAWSGDSAHD